MLKIENSVNHILKKYCKFEEENHSGILLLDLPTGFGKTYETLKYIYEIYNTQKDKKIIFLTDLKKNLPHDTTFKSFFEKENRLDDYNRDVIFANSNVDTIIDFLPQLVEEISDIVKDSKEFKDLFKQVKIYNELFKKNDKQSFEYEILGDKKNEIRLKYE
ncbi:MAG: DEAD/DEAH box helicase family protein, partial [Saprospiraceae bacterium]